MTLAREATLREVLADDRLQLPDYSRGNARPLGDQSMPQGLPALAASFTRQTPDRFLNDGLSVLAILLQIGNDHLNSHGFVSLVPTIVVRNQRDGNVANLRFAPQLRYKLDSALLEKAGPSMHT